MLIIISPAKNLRSEPFTYRLASKIEFPNETKQLISVLKRMNAYELTKLMHISPKLGELNFERIQRWSYPFSGNTMATAIYMYHGDVYRGLQAEKFSDDEMDFAQKHLRILSGLYGVLRPWDIIMPYRLDASAELNTATGKNLYDFWGDKIRNKIKRQIKEQNDRVLINLASGEYYQLVKSKNPEAEIITPVFKEYKQGEYKQIAILAKRARGLMARYIICNKLVDPEGLKGFDYEKYSFSEPLSTKKELVFTR
jgi:cytoplasmic iron level regulating protein YaaA (DUF328/UPF0246 family)